MSNVSEELLQEWKRAGYHSNGKSGKSAFGEGGIALSQLDGPFERDFHAMRKRLGELEDQLTKSRLVKPALDPIIAVPLEGVVDEVNKRYRIPAGVGGRFLVVMGGCILRPEIDFSLDGDAIVAAWSPDNESYRPVLYLFK